MPVRLLKLEVITGHLSLLWRIFQVNSEAVRTCPLKLWRYLLFMCLKMAIRFLNWSLWLIILLRYVSKDFQVTSEFDSFKIQFQKVDKSTSSRICYAWITCWQRSSFASRICYAWITGWQRSSLTFSSHEMFFFASPNKGLLLRVWKRKWFKSRISYYSNATASF